MVYKIWMLYLHTDLYIFEDNFLQLKAISSLHTRPIRSNHPQIVNFLLFPVLSDLTRWLNLDWCITAPFLQCTGLHTNPCSRPTAFTQSTRESRASFFHGLLKIVSSLEFWGLYTCPRPWLTISAPNLAHSIECNHQCLRPLNGNHDSLARVVTNNKGIGPSFQCPNDKRDYQPIQWVPNCRDPEPIAQWR